MDKITFEQFLVRQPSFPKEMPTDRFYFDLANHLADVAGNKRLFPDYPDAVVGRCALTVIGYLQDVISDAGIWRAFINGNRILYGRTLPFFDEENDYVDYELNRNDIRFLCWYALSMYYEDRRDASPLDKEILRGADEWFEELESVYEEAPLPEGFCLSHQLDMNDPEDAEQLYNLGNWVFLHSYLMTPAYAQTLSNIMAQPGLSDPENFSELRQALEKSMMEDPTGPLALFIKEWLYLIVEGQFPSEPSEEKKDRNHPYYDAVMKYTDGFPVVFFKNYTELNRFFIDVLGWERGEEHLPQMKEEKYLAVMVNRTKGMLVARDVARCLFHPSNPYYDKEYAAKNAMDFLTVRGRCPGDLTRYACEHDMLPDAVFPGTTDHRLVKENYDFIARCYLQLYYRD